MKISYLKGDLSAVRTISLDKLVKELTREQPMRAITAFREMIPYVSPHAHPAESNRVPALLFPSLYEGNEWKSYTGLVLVEFNRLSSMKEAEQLRTRLVQYTNPLLAFIGVSGRSVKVVTRYTLPDGTLPAGKEEALLFHQHAYHKAASHYQHQAGRNVTAREPRLDTICRMSWDKQCYFNPEAPVIKMELPAEQLPGQVALPAEPVTNDPLAGILPGMEQYERVEFLFENCLRKVQGEEGQTWDPADPKSYLVCLARYCYQSGVPEEDTVRWIKWHSHAGRSLELIRMTVHNVYVAMAGKPLKPVVSGAQKLLWQTEEFLHRRYELRKNVINGQVEFREKHTFCFHFSPVTPEVLNGICLEAQQEGIELWDKDIRRYIYSPRVAIYNPLQEFLFNLPRWDGKDRIRELAGRVPNSDPEWNERFYKWFVSMVAQWIRENKMHGNTLIPVLQGGQGTSKSVFFRMILPPALRDYYAENINLQSNREAQLSMAQHVLINLDEFDRIGKKSQSDLKNLSQLPTLSIKPPHQKSFQRLKRIASFCATANPEELLSDFTGSRRYICIRVEGPIEVSQPIAYEQLYAQAMEFVHSGQQYWLSPEEEQAMTESNREFAQRSLLLEYLFTYFRKPEPGEKGTLYKSLELVDIISRRSRRKFGNISARDFGAELKAAGIQAKHMRWGNGYELIEIKDNEQEVPGCD